MSQALVVDYATSPEHYRHWTLETDGPVATLTMKVDEDGGLREGYKLKLNSYDLGVDIELYDAVQRIRFEHPQVRTVVITGGRDRIFCSGANIFMLGKSSHAWKVNFCKFTNETRNGLEDSSQHSGLKFIAAVCNNILRAAFAARYPYQPPLWLSSILPTRADKVAYTARSFVANKGEKYLISSAGPTALMRNC